MRRVLATQYAVQSSRSFAPPTQVSINGCAGFNEPQVSVLCYARIVPTCIRTNLGDVNSLRHPFNALLVQLFHLLLSVCSHLVAFLAAQFDLAHLRLLMKYGLA